jgi:ATP-dependent 26S proteasome regulatory subunit
MSKTRINELLTKTLLDGRMPADVCAGVLRQKLLEGEIEDNAVLSNLITAARANQGDQHLKETVNKYTAMLEELQAGTLRLGYYLGETAKVGVSRRAHCLLQDGQEANPVVHDETLFERLELGTRVLMDAGAKLVVGVDPHSREVGEMVELLHQLDDHRAVVKVRGIEKRIVHLSAPLAGQISREEVKPGSSLVVCPRAQLAFQVVEEKTGSSPFRFLVTDPPPNLRLDDLASPPRAFYAILDHVRREMTDPETCRRYGLNRAISKFLIGPTGTGKTYGLTALIGSAYELMSELTGVPIDQLPCRVLRLRPSEVFSKWLGESEKHLDIFHDEVEQVADAPFLGPDGRIHHLATFAIIEESDAIGRARRGSDEDHVGRILVTMLQRLDVNWRNLGQKLVVFLFTSNVPELMDPALVRRAGGEVVVFGRLDRAGFAAVLEKQLKDRPIRKSHAANGRRWGNGDRKAPDGNPARELANLVADALYSPNAEHDRTGQVEITFAGSTAPVIKHQRDFLSGAIVAQAVQNAAARACQAELCGDGEGGLTSAMLLEEIAGQVQGVVHQLAPHNAGLYVALPDGERVVRIRRLRQPRHVAASLEAGW